MSYAVVHMQKFKASDVKGIQVHNQRERESKSNPDIDKARSQMNYDLHNQEPINYNRTVKKIMANLLDPEKTIRKDAVVMSNFVITSDKAFFDALQPVDQRRFFEKSYEFFKERYGEDRVVAAAVHMDEMTPHMHFSLVPITQEKKLAAKTLFDRKELRSIQDDFPKFMQSQGFNLERGLDAEGKNKHIDIQKLKAMEIEKRLQALSQEKNAIETDLNALRDDFGRLEEVKVAFNRIKSIEGKPTLLSKEKVTVNGEDFKLLKDMACRQEVLESKLQQIQNENSRVKTDLNDVYKASQKATEKNHELRLKIKDLKSENQDLHRIVELFADFTKTAGVFDQAKEFINEQINLEVQRENAQQQKARDMENEWEMDM